MSPIVHQAVQQAIEARHKLQPAYTHFNKCNLNLDVQYNATCSSLMTTKHPVTLLLCIYSVLSRY